MHDVAYLVVTGAGTARRAPELLGALAPHFRQVLTILTPNAHRIVSPRELALVEGHRIVESYFDDAILPRPPRGVVLVAPCSFDSLNKLACGIADNLAMSVTAEAIGRDTPVIVAVSVNVPLWNHPRGRESAAALRRWGCSVIDPWPDDDALTLAPTELIVAEVLRRRDTAPD